jgi:hypothetical protein
MVIEKRTREDWEVLVSKGMNLREQKDECQFELGDLAMEVETSYGEDTMGKFSYAIGVEKKTMMNYRTVSERFDKEVRNKYRKLSFSHFSVLTATELPEAWLEKADDEEWSVEMLRKELKKAYPNLEDVDLSDDPPDVYRCPECRKWRLKDMSTFDICRGHYTIKKGDIVYE